jgi:hypothetical protein
MSLASHKLRIKVQDTMNADCTHLVVVYCLLILTTDSLFYQYHLITGDDKLHGNDSDDTDSGSDTDTDDDSDTEQGMHTSQIHVIITYTCLPYAHLTAHWSMRCMLQTQCGRIYC